ncbi:hypothetical protein KC218_25155, partial [Mycobacterium tuberculosis]|nr:hypothetical protein [Mycobacterium tuberculosis]
MSATAVTTDGFPAAGGGARRRWPRAPWRSGAGWAGPAGAAAAGLAGAVTPAGPGASLGEAALVGR